MKLFTELYVRLDQTNKTNEKVEAMRSYFEIDTAHIVVTVLHQLAGLGLIENKIVDDAIRDFELDPEAQPPRLA